jgi:hypothetical protein
MRIVQILAVLLGGTLISVSAHEVVAATSCQDSRPDPNVAARVRVDGFDRRWVPNAAA